MPFVLFNRFAEVEIRGLRGMTKAQLARAASKSAPYITQLEGDARSNPSPSAIRDLAAALEVDARALYVDPTWERLLDELVEKINGDHAALDAAVTRLRRVKELGK